MLRTKIEKICKNLRNFNKKRLQRVIYCVYERIFFIKNPIILYPILKVASGLLFMDFQVKNCVSRFFAMRAGDSMVLVFCLACSKLRSNWVSCPAMAFFKRAFSWIMASKLANCGDCFMV
jgi:hypothetical protein